MRVPPSGDAPIHDSATIRDSWEDDAERITRRVHAALNSGRDRAVVAVVLDETAQLRAQLAIARAAVARVVAILPPGRNAVVSAGRVRDALFTAPGAAEGSP